MGRKLDFIHLCRVTESGSRNVFKSPSIDDFKRATTAWVYPRCPMTLVVNAYHCRQASLAGLVSPATQRPRSTLDAWPALAAERREAVYYLARMKFPHAIGQAWFQVS
jgi:hypothetical protein